MHSLNGNTVLSTNTGGSSSSSSSSNGSSNAMIDDLSPTSDTIETLSSLNNNKINSHSILKQHLNGNHNQHDHRQHHQSQALQFSNGQKDILRLIGQHLRQLGLIQTTDLLVQESGCMLEHPVATNFSNLILNGDWDKAEKSLVDLKSIIDLNTDIIMKMKFLILEQKYLECLEDGRILEALKCLRDELAPLKFNTDRVHELSSFLMCAGSDDLKKLSKWEGKSMQSRQTLMDKLQTFLPPNIMLPPKRLEALIHQAIEYQCEQCPFHNSNDKISVETSSLLKDHTCTREQFPSVCIQTINDHCDEVWFCKFSNDGTRLATGSKDGALIIWDVNPHTYKLTHNKTYDEHTCGVAYVVWSPDDHYLLVCGTEECSEMWIWDMQQKCLRKRLSNSPEDSFITAAWFADSQTFVAGGTKGQFYMCDIDGNIRETWEGVRVRCVQCLKDGTVLAADSLKRIRNYNFKEMHDSNVIQENHQIMFFTLNQTCTQVLLNVAAQGVHLWDLKDCVLVRRFQGANQNNFMNFCSFGGLNENFIVSGSEDNRVYIWNRRDEKPICVLEGHLRNVNCVSWNPKIHAMIASASDDGTIKIWGPQNANNESTTTNFSRTEFTQSLIISSEASSLSSISKYDQM